MRKWFRKVRHAPWLRTAAIGAAYQPLGSNEIRVLVLQPGEPEDPLHGSLLHTTLDNGETLPYETISYAWGDASGRGCILIGDQLTDIPHSSEVVLRRMRLKDRPGALWIDSIGIHQRNIEERSAQVAMMDRVYSHGRTNLIWLGEDVHGTAERAVNEIRSTAEEMRVDSDNFSDLSSRMYSEAYVPVLLDSHVRTQYATKALANIYSSPWSTRLWVVQEVVLAHRNICHYGQLELALEVVPRAARWTFHVEGARGYGPVLGAGLQRASGLADIADPVAG